VNPLAQWGFYFDQTRCVNCKACVLACKSWNEDKRGDADITPELAWLATGGYAEPAEYDNLPGSFGEQNFKEYSKYHMKENWRRVYTREYGSEPPEIDVSNLSVSCNHCREPACVRACPTKCIYKEEEYGIVRTDPDKPCIACRRCKTACPWDSPQYYDNALGKYGSAKPRMTKCELCIDRIREGLKPACVAACIMRALDAGPLEELKETYPGWSDRLEDFPDGRLPEIGIDTGPSIIFRKKPIRVRSAERGSGRVPALAKSFQGEVK
jgi:anaerobic dimethyl sulfoxide reductase subunit B (iron-sulfur subunit)